MSDARSNRRARVVPFINQMDKDRSINLQNLINKAKKFEFEGFELAQWDHTIWKINAGRLIKLTGKNTASVSLVFHYPPKIGNTPLSGDWGDVLKALVLIRFHRKNQSATNQRIFIAAVGYIAYEALKNTREISELRPEHLDAACQLISSHYSASSAYNMHKAINEFAAHCDANGLCKNYLDYKFAGMKRPENADDIGYKRLDDPEILKTKSDKLIDPTIFRILGELYQNVPKGHKYRFYILILTLLACLGRRFSEIALLPYQTVQHDDENKSYIEYFPRKVSQGDAFTPRRKLYLPTATVEIIDNVIAELGKYCANARKKATEMQKPNEMPIHIDQHGKKYFLKDLLLVKQHSYKTSIVTQCTHSMLSTFLRFFDKLCAQYATSSAEVHFTSHHFRHTLNTLLDEGGLSDLLQTEWFGRTNPKDTKAYQHTSREKRALMLREDIKNGQAGGHLAEVLKSIPVTMHDALLKARVNAVHDVGTGICVHNFVQTPCERHLQCSADCKDYVWIKDDKGRVEEVKRQYAITKIARDTAEAKSLEKNSKKSSDWLIHNNKKLATLSKQLSDNNISEFETHKYLEELKNERTLP